MSVHVIGCAGDLQETVPFAAHVAGTTNYIIAI